MVATDGMPGMGTEVIAPLTQCRRPRSASAIHNPPVPSAVIASTRCGMSDDFDRGSGTNRPPTYRHRPRSLATHSSSSRSTCSRRRLAPFGSGCAIGSGESAAGNSSNASMVPTHSVPDDVVPIPAASPMSVICVALCGDSRVTPSGDPTQTLLSRSSNSALTPLERRPVNTVARSSVAMRCRSSNRTRNSP